MSLKEYQRKRHFGSTPEPDAKAKPKTPKGNLRFVIQKHEASRTHYDFRLELNGALMSWAVPRGPTLTSGEPRLAVHVEDHPIAYGSFEGVIPRGNYGAGTVMIWDEGEYLERGSQNRKESEAALKKGMQKGHITFLLFGKKLQGEFALIRIKKKGAPDNGWLLVKKHDEYASRHDITKEDRSVVSDRTMREIASQSEGKGDVWLPKKGRKTPAKEVKRKPTLSLNLPKPKAKGPTSSPLPRKIKVMQPVVSGGAPTEGEWYFTNFGEGIRAMAEVDNNPHLYSKAFLPLERKYPQIVKALKGLNTKAIFDGEINKRGEFLVQDVLYWEGKDLRGVALSDRRKTLKKISFTKPLVLAECADSLEDLPVLGKEVLARSADSLYQSGIHRDWVRFPAPRRSKAEKAKTTTDKTPLTNLDKIFWPEEKYTKGDLVRYYESVADYILPHLKDRPESLLRQPNGIKGKGFFHKDMTGFLPRRLETVKVYSASSEKTILYLLCQDKWALLYLINMGCIELNPWLSRKQNLENPDFVVIDLDPDDNKFEEVIDVALEVKRVLDSIGAKSYCKTSGGTGLHICVPTGAKFDFDVTRIFAEKVCKVVTKAFPKNTSLERTPAKRRKKIYLDYLQNRRGQTLAAPYCVRPRPKAPVSTPLKWSEVKRGLKPENFTIENTLSRLKKTGDLWSPVLNTAVDIEKCQKTLEKLYGV